MATVFFNSTNCSWVYLAVHPFPLPNLLVPFAYPIVAILPPLWKRTQRPCSKTKQLFLFSSLLDSKASSVGAKMSKDSS